MKNSRVTSQDYRDLKHPHIRTSEPPNHGNLTDPYNRIITYLRVSVTDRCNLRCTYCLPGKVEFLPHTEIMKYEEITRVVKAAVELGVCKVRITGGEPLVRKELPRLIEKLACIKGVEELTLTTNGILLSEYAADLRKAGLHRINVSLDTIHEGRYREICRFGSLQQVIEGIHAATDAGLSPVKINVVVIRGKNDDELLDFIRFGQENSLSIRFIEYMPANQTGDWGTRYVSRDEILLKIGSVVDRERISNAGTFEPARYFQVKDGGEVGIISPVSHSFCDFCNRLRLTPDGYLQACLMSPPSVDIKKALRTGCDDEQLKRLFHTAIQVKGRRGDVLNSRFAMHRIGG